MGGTIGMQKVVKDALVPFNSIRKKIAGLKQCDSNMDYIDPKNDFDSSENCRYKYKGYDY